FTREDQWTSVGNIGHYPLVLDPTIAGMTVTKVLIDGGAGLNIIFLETLRKMGLQLAGMITPTSTPFYGIVPGVADFESSYHTILGRPALAKFMAIPHYPYLLLNMPGPNGSQ
ncbi:uncharacterized protein, partial [Miscanthus floridulus]|uniref:uncharacterized protein n=1 Tax=Miscanthus floridulus TaxID=154761 RepID=UPI00345841D3